MGGKATPNTIIGGVGSVITTKSALATKLGISESIIQGFKIVGSDIHCKITSNYSIGVNTFNSDVNITSYLDFDGKCINVGQAAFSGSTIIDAVFPNAVLGVLAFGSVSAIKCLSNDNFGYQYDYYKSTIGNEAFRRTKIKHLNIPNLTTISTNLIRNNNDLISVLGGNVTSIGADAFVGCINLVNIDLENVTTIHQRAFSDCTSMPFFDLLSLTSLRFQVFYDCSSCEYINMPMIENISDAERVNLFRGLSSCNLISMKKLKTLGDPSTSNSSTFQALKMGCTIEVNEFMATSNAGNADATLVWVKANRSAVVEFYDDNGDYVSTL